ncbi:MAG: hypothetical protein WC683_07330 [bacterium]
MKEDPYPTTTEDITLDTAKRYLAASKGNRRINEFRVDTYVRDMLAGRWYIGETIKFDSNGVLLDGHHRLLAILKYGLPVRSLVTRNLPPESIRGIDLGQPRTHDQISKFMNEGFSKRHFSIAKFMEFGEHHHNLSYNEVRDLALKYDESISWVCTVGGHEKFLNTPVMTVLAKAWYSLDRTRLKEFMDVFKTKLATSDRDWAAIKLRDCLEEARYYHTILERGAIYLRAQSAVYHFCKGTPLKLLRPATKDYFPLKLDAEGKVVPA